MKVNKLKELDEILDHINKLELDVNPNDPAFQKEVGLIAEKISNMHVMKILMLIEIAEQFKQVLVKNGFRQ